MTASTASQLPSVTKEKTKQLASNGSPANGDANEDESSQQSLEAARKAEKARREAKAGPGPAKGQPQAAPGPPQVGVFYCNCPCN